MTKSLLDWNGDHPYTNYRSMFTTLRSLGYYVDTLTSSWMDVDLSACVNLSGVCNLCSHVCVQGGGAYGHRAESRLCASVMTHV